MKKLLLMLVVCAFVLIPATLFASPTVYPTGTTIYKPEKCWNGYTVLSTRSLYPYGDKMVMNPIIDMNGNEVHNWTDAGSGKLLPGGHLLGRGAGADALVQVDWDGNVEARWEGYRIHHDQQKEGNPVGYYVPGMEFVDEGNVLILGRETDPLFKPWEGPSTIAVVTWDGEVVWDWHSSDHLDEIQASTINCASWLGPNKWYDAGDERFHPDNVIFDNTTGDSIIIISKETGNVAWRVGPDYTEAPQLAYLGFVEYPRPFAIPPPEHFVGGMLHHAHMIPKGLPGEGNILVFNNGKPFSLITEFDPVTLQIVWEYSGPALGYGESHSWAQTFYSGSESSVQRLPNGNTLICEADTGRVFEVTPELETVWEYINPRMWGGGGKTNGIYRAYRVPYDWCPQLERPIETAVIQPDNTTFRVEEPDEPKPVPITGWGIAPGTMSDGGGF